MNLRVTRASWIGLPDRPRSVAKRRRTQDRRKPEEESPKLLNQQERLESPEHTALPCSLAVCEPDSVFVPVWRGWALGHSVQAG